MITAFLVVFTSPFWILPLTYCFLKTLLFAPSGVIIWIAIASLVGFALWAGFSWIREIVRTGRTRNALRLGALGGDEVADQENQALQLNRSPVGLFASAVIAIHLLMGPAAAMGLWHQINESPETVKVNGHWRALTPQEGLKVKLRTIEQRGVFKPITSLD